MIFSPSQEHVSEAEHNNQVIKERVHATYHCLPYKSLTTLMIKMLVTESTKKLNFFPSKNVVSNFYSPCMIMQQRNLDNNQHCRYALRSYVQAHDEPALLNSKAPHTFDCIPLCYTEGMQGGYELHHLLTNSRKSGRNFTQVPITTSIIHQVHTLATNADLQEGL
jgi:hypothetical protein